MSIITLAPPTQPSGPSTRSTLRTTRRLVVRLLPAGIAILLLVDWRLGETAEFYNAIGLLEAWGQVIGDGAIEPGHEFLIGQASLGTAAAMAIGTALLVIEPALALTVLVLPVVWIRNRIRRGRGQ